MIALTGATGFVGSRVLRRLQVDGHAVRCLTRRPEALGGCAAVRADVLDAESLMQALDGAELAYYLVHALGEGGGFDEQEAAGARNFADAARVNGVRRIVYLGGLAQGVDLSDHMRSRHEVGRILAASGVDTVELRASIVIGNGSLSFELMRTLVDEFPVRALPSWTNTRCQPLGVDDLVEYLVRARDVPGGVYEIGGADVLTYRDLLAAYGDESGQGRMQIDVPAVGVSMIPDVLSGRLPRKGRAALRLVESMQVESTVRDDAAAIFGVKPRGVREAIRSALEESA